MLLYNITFEKLCIFLCRCLMTVKRERSPSCTSVFNVYNAMTSWYRDSAFNEIILSIQCNFRQSLSFTRKPVCFPFWKETNKTPQNSKLKTNQTKTQTKSNPKPLEKGTLIVYYNRKWERWLGFCWLLMKEKKKNQLAAFTDLGFFL